MNLDAPDSPQDVKVGSNHPWTSYQAPRFGSERARVLEVVAAWSASGGATAAEVADHLGKSRNQVATRMLELREMGWIERVLDAENEYVVRSTGPSSVGIVHVLRVAAYESYNKWKDSQ